MTSSADCTRPRGRIGGVVGIDASPEVMARLSGALGARSVVLAVGPGVGAHRAVADWDQCSADGRRLELLDDWDPYLDRARLAEVHGAFALAWWDPHSATLHLARDAVGERSLFYHRVGGGLVFASTVRALMATGLVPRALDLAAIAAYLTYSYVPGPRTLVKDVFEVEPGELVELRAGSLSRQPYWQLPPEDRPSLPEETYRHLLREELTAAVDRRLPVDGPVAASLSGGVDSSLVVALAQRARAQPIHTVSLSFGPDHPNELAYSSQVAAHCGSTQEVLELDASAVLEHLDATMALLSTPIGDPLTVPNALLFRHASERFGTVLNGEGGDPCFGGPKNLPMVLSELYASPESRADPWRRERAYLRAHGRCYDELAEMFVPAVRDTLPFGTLEHELTPRLLDTRWGTLVNRLMAINIAFKGASHILSKVDHLSAAAGVVPASPLFDRGVVELACRMPAELKLRGAREKHILKEAVSDLLPPEIIERRKSGMRVPVEAWFQERLLPEAKQRLLDGLGRYGVIERSYLERLLNLDSPEKRQRRGAKIWLLVSLEAWLRTVYVGWPPPTPDVPPDGG